MPKIQKKELELLASLRMQELLSALGANGIKKNGSYIQCSCPVHNGDNQHAFVFYLDQARWICYTNACHGDRNSADVFDLVGKSLHIDFPSAVRWIEDFLGVKTDNEAFAKAESIQALTRKKRKTSVILPDMFLNMFTKEEDVPLSYYEQRGYAKSTLKYFDVHYCFSKNSVFHNRALIPLHDPNGNLVGVSGRWMGDHKQDGTEKFINTKGMMKGQLLYNWHRAQKYFDCGYVFLAESPGVVWNLHQLGRFNSVASLSGNITLEQVKLIASNPKINTIVLAFDSDKAGRDLCERAAKMLYGKVDVQIMDIDEGMDFDKINAGEFSQYFAARKIFSLQD